MKRAEISILSNPASGWNKKHLPRLAARAAELGIPHETIPCEAIPEMLDRLAGEGKRLLVLNGGDGTLDAVVRHLREARPFEEEPFLGLLPGGTSNMSQRDIGRAGSPLSGLARLATVIERGDEAIVLRRPLKIEGHGDGPLYGFFLGIGAVPKAVRFARRQWHSKGLTGPFGEGLVLANTFWRLCRGQVENDPILGPETLFLAENDAAEQPYACVCGLVTTLHRLLLGLRPIAPRDELGLFLLSHPCRQMPSLIGRLLLRRPLSPQPGLRLGRAGTLTLRLDSPFLLDGELFDTNPDTLLRVSVEPPLRFLRL